MGLLADIFSTADTDFRKLPASNFSAIGGMSGRPSDKPCVTDFVDAKGCARHWFPNNLFHGKLDSIQLPKFPDILNITNKT